MKFIVASEDQEMIEAIMAECKLIQRAAPAPRGVVVTISDDSDGKRTLAETLTVPGKVRFYTPDMRKFCERENRSTGFHIAAAQSDPVGYIVAHEWGHLHQPLEYCNVRTGPVKGAAKKVIKRLTHGTLGLAQDVYDALSLYGKTAIGEAYGETFAEWYLTHGYTRNIATRYFAAAFRWELS